MTQPVPKRLLRPIIEHRNLIIAIVALIGILLYLLFHFLFHLPATWSQIPLIATLVIGGVPLVGELLIKLVHRQFGSDLLAGLSIVTSIIMGEYLAGAIVILMLSGGETLEEYAINRASSVLRALADRLPSITHRRVPSGIEDVPIETIAPGDEVILYPHEIVPVDGVVIDGDGSVDEAYLTGEPFRISKGRGSEVISGSINGESVLTIRATHPASDSRYARIMRVMQESEQSRPTIRRLGDQIGAWYTPLALVIAALAWGFSGESIRFLSVLVIATPCPLLIAIPVAIIGSISLSARRSVIVRNPAALEQISRCDTAIFDKTGTLTYGEPALVSLQKGDGFEEDEILRLTSGLERYSTHPLGRALLREVEERGIRVPEGDDVRERPGEGLRGNVEGREIIVTNRKGAVAAGVEGWEEIPVEQEGLECVIVIDNVYAATCLFRDRPRSDSRSFVKHLEPRHGFVRKIILSGDRESEVRYLAGQVGVEEIYAGKSPEEKLELVKEIGKSGTILYVGDGINDAPAMTLADVGVALGEGSDVTTEAADVVILDNSLSRVDEFLHIGRRMRRIALQSALGGIGVSLAGMILAAFGYLTPVEGAIAQEVIDLLAVFNALRAAFPPRVLNDMSNSDFAE